jgi:hypothetical protein
VQKPLFLHQFAKKRMIFTRNFFYKIDAETSYLGDASVKNHLPLRGGFWHRICHLYSELEVIKVCGEGGRGNSLSGRHFIPEATSPLRVVKKNKNKVDHSSSWAGVLVKAERSKVYYGIDLPSTSLGR